MNKMDQKGEHEADPRKSGEKKSDTIKVGL